MSTELIIRPLNVDMIAPNPSNYLQPDQGGSKIVVIGKPGCFAEGTRVLFYDGSVHPIETIQKGDRIMGDDGTCRTVLGLFHNQDDMFEICPNDGSTGYIVNSHHDLVVTRFSTQPKEEGGRTWYHIPVDTFLTLSQQERRKYRIIRSTYPLEFGGCSEWGPESLPLRNIQWEKKDSYSYALERFSGPPCQEPIPPCYSKGSIDVRLAFLYGVLHACGRPFPKVQEVDQAPFSCIPRSTKEEYPWEIISRGATEDETILFIVRSLGGSATYSSPPFPERRKEESLSTVAEPVPLVLRITLSTTGTYEYLPFRVRHVGYQDFYGFELDGNRRFLLGDFHVVKNTGKTTLITSLLYEKSDLFPVGMIMSGTEDSNGHYRKIFPSTFVYNRLEEDQIDKFITRQKIAKKHVPNPWAILLLDDCTDDPKILQKSIFQSLYKNGRHWKMLYILSLQYCMDIKPVIRTNIDGTFILRETNLRNRKVLWENYGGPIHDFGLFCKILDCCTDNYTALYIHNATQSNKIEDCVFWYRAKPVPPDFRFGSPNFWKFHRHRYDTNYKDPFIL